MSRGQRVKTGVVGLLERAQERLAKTPGTRTGEAPELASREARGPLESGSGPGAASHRSEPPVRRGPAQGGHGAQAPPGQGLQEILSGVLARMRIPESEFRRYLDQHGGALRHIAERKQY